MAMQINDFHESTEMSYPCYIISNSSDLMQHQAMVLQQMLKPILGVLPDYKVYIKEGGDVFEIGGITRRSVKSFIDLVGSDNLEMMTEKGKVYRGHMLYALG